MTLEHRPSKRRLEWNGLPINIEIEVGEKKSGFDKTGMPWEHVYAVPYGEIERTQGDDGDPVDVYLGPAQDAAYVYVVHQLNMDGTPDEDKVMLGFLGAAAAQAAYRAHGPSWGFGSMDEMNLDQFVHGYLAANRAPAHQIYNSSIGRELNGQKRYGS